MRKGIVIMWLAIVFAGIVALFWRNEWIYSLPTPVPDNYCAVDPGTRIALPPSLRPVDGKPVLLHFFNPQCPCSRFNMDHFRSLVKQYGDKVNFNVIVVSNKEYTVREIQDKFNLDVPVSFDTTLATLCGVYSTPQAVILDASRQLRYRGNYNKTRYCTEKKTEYARMALKAILNKHETGITDKYALQAYGCQLPTCNKK